MNNDLYSNLLLTMAVILFLITAITGDIYLGITAIWCAIFSVEYGIKAYIDEKESKV